MVDQPDLLIDRRRLKRRLFFWRAATFVVAAGLVVAGAVLALGPDRITGGGDRIARISITGFIAPDRKFTELLERLGKNDHVKGVIVSLNTPGGSTAAGEALSEALRTLAARKPTVAHIDALAASAGYMAAISTDHIVARRNALTGSIGVIMQWPDVSDLLSRLGVKYEEVKSTPMKAEPTPFKPVSPEARAMLDKAIRDSYERFVAQVADRRGLTADKAHELADGRVVTGAMAKDLGLVDALGGEEVAVDWLVSRGVDRQLKIVDEKKSAGGVWNALDGQSAIAGLVRGTAEGLGLRLPPAGDGALDGLLSVWHPESAEK